MRHACLFRIKPELKAEYKKAHDEIWPDMARAIRKSGIRNYSIYFRDDGTLFSYFECRDPGRAFAYMGRAGSEWPLRILRSSGRMFYPWRRCSTSVNKRRNRAPLPA